MSWENDATGYLAELSRQTGGQQPATIGQVWDSEWKRGGLDTIAGVGQPFGDARGELVTAIETAAGRPIEDYAAQMGVRLGSGVTQAEDIRLLGALADTLPEDKRKSIEPLKDVRLNAARKAQKIEADADEIGNATYGLSGVATAFIAGVARQAADPVNVAAMVATAPLGAARGASLLMTVGREAGANAAAQAAVEPIVEPARERLGLDSGVGRAVGNVLEAGIGGGVLSGLFHVAGRGLRTLRGERPAEAAGTSAPAEGAIVSPEGVARASDSGTAPVARPAPAPAGPLAPAGPAEQFAPDDFHAAGDLAERDHVIDVMAPIDTADGRLDHAAKVDAAAARIEVVGGVSTPAMIYRGEALPNVGVVPANMAPDGTIYVGKKNGQHFLISEEHGESVRQQLDLQPGQYTWKDTGFVNPQGEFLNRAQALEWVTANEKKIRPSENMAGELDALDYRDQVPEAKRSSGASSLAARANAAAAVMQIEPPKKTNRGRSNADPQSWSLNEFLASKGGLKPDPELSAIFGTEKGPFVPGFGPLVRKGGTTLDEALKAAKEAGYLFDARDLDRPDNGTLGRSGRTDMGLTPNDLLDRLDAENRGQKLYRHDRAPDRAIDDGEEAHAIVGALEKELFDSGGGDIRVDQAIADRVVQIVRQEKETDLLAAYERAIMEDAERYEGLAAARANDAELAKIPGWDADEPGAAPRDGAADPAKRRQAERAGQGDGGKDGAEPRDAGQGDRAPRQLGDPALAADAARALEDAGGDFEITLQNPDGTTRTLKATDALREVEDDVRAADELNACIAGAAEEAPF
ncbi:hypothetical protein [Rhodopseudomonas sp. RCAM05734]|uniref:hypothetical protein n=1 Tax=Rhodopseudomonas sp. RCAM05734 TaxID=3457549 RepID=UPI004044AAD9